MGTRIQGNGTTSYTRRVCILTVMAGLLIAPTLNSNSTIHQARPSAALRGPPCGADGWTPTAAPAVVYRGLPLAHVNVARRDADMDRPVRVAAERPRGAGADHA